MAGSKEAGSSLADKLLDKGSSLLGDIAESYGKIEAAKVERDTALALQQQQQMLERDRVQTPQEQANTVTVVQPSQTSDFLQNSKVMIGAAGAFVVAIVVVLIAVFKK